jgi:hypothetical protein
MDTEFRVLAQEAPQCRGVYSKSQDYEVLKEMLVL